jgi:hypothetical protein
MKGRNSETVGDRLLRNCQKTDLRHMWIEDAAHRFAYQTWVQSIPAGMFVLHRCDNPSCIRPEHLFLGTALDNAEDRDRKKRGKFNPRAGDNGRKAPREFNGRFKAIAEHFGSDSPG